MLTQTSIEALPLVLRRPLNPIRTPASLLLVWNTYEVACWRRAMSERGLCFKSLDPEIQKAMLAAFSSERR